MRVAMLAPISWRVPPRHYGPWEQVVSVLTEGLVARGIEVTLFATGDSITAARLASVCPRPYSEDPTLDVKVRESLHISAAFERANEFDLIHNHFDFLPLTYSRLVQTPVLTTIHGFSSDRILPVYEKYNPYCHYIAISNADRHPRLNYLATIHHGIKVEDFQFRADHGNYLLFFGRIHPDKGTAEAIEVANRAGLPLIIAGIIQDSAYFDREVAPHLDNDHVRFIGPVGPDRRGGLLGGARALLHLINFWEPFGLSMVEAMACGTPVIARPLGAVPEIVINERTGFLVDTPEDAVYAVKYASKLNRRFIRHHVEANFASERMVDQYMDTYTTALAAQEGRNTMTGGNCNIFPGAPSPTLDEKPQTIEVRESLGSMLPGESSRAMPKARSSDSESTIGRRPRRCIGGVILMPPKWPVTSSEFDRWVSIR